MSGNGTPNGPSNPESLATERIPVGADLQVYVTGDSYTHLFPDPLPSRIMRFMRSKTGGTIGENQLDAANPDYGRGYIPHEYIPRRPVTVTPYDKNIDVTTTIPAIYVGDPLH